jgi:hypothetical protein
MDTTDLGRSLRFRHIQSLQNQQMSAAAQIGKKTDEREGLMRRFVPVD